MDRYQFEDAISDYLENSLTLKKRKEFKQYIIDNPDAKMQVDSIRKTMESVKRFATVDTSVNFLEKLEKRLKTENVHVSEVSRMSRSTYFGMKPVYAAITAFTLVGIILVGYQLLPNPSAPVGNIPLGASIIQNQPGGEDINLEMPEVPSFAGSQDQDSTNSDLDSTRKINQNIQNRIQYVKNPR